MIERKKHCKLWPFLQVLKDLIEDLISMTEVLLLLTSLVIWGKSLESYRSCRINVYTLASSWKTCKISLYCNQFCKISAEWPHRWTRFDNLKQPQRGPKIWFGKNVKNLLPLHFQQNEFKFQTPSKNEKVEFSGSSLQFWSSASSDPRPLWLTLWFWFNYSFVNSAFQKSLLVC